MSKQEIVDGYLSGSISRRTFVRRISAAGLSVGAALSYAELLGAKTAHARPGHPDFYGDFYDCDFYDDFYECGATGPPGVQNQDPTSIEQSSALANGLVDPHGLPTDYWFQYRPVGALGALETADGGLPAGNGYVPVSALLSGLSPGTDYEYRAFARNAVATAHNVAWVKFKTAAPGTAGSGGGGGAVAGMAAAASTLGGQPPLVKPGGGPPPGAPKIRIGALPALSSVQKTHVITIPVTVDQEADVTALVKKGRRKVVKPARKSAKRGLVRVAGPGLALTRADKTVNVKLRLTRTGVRLLKDRKAVNVLVEVEAVNRDGVIGVLRSMVHLAH